MSGRVPFGRAVLLLQLVAALTFLGYTAAKKGVGLPFVSDEPFELEVLLADGRGLVPSKEPAVGVAGVPGGKVTRVRLEEGRARVTMRLDADMEGKVFRDASVVVRPTSILQTLIVNIDPGTPASGKLERGATIPVSRTSAFVHIDELTETLDADTRAQVHVLVGELAGALDGREPELRKIAGELGRVTDAATPLADALSDRRRLLRRLTDNLDVVLGTLGERGRQLAGAVALGDETLALTSRRAPQVEDGVRRLAPVVGEGRRALVAARGLAQPLVPALDRLQPVARDALPTGRSLRAVAPDLSRFVEAAGRVARDGGGPARKLAGGLKRQAELIENDQKPALQELIGLIELLDTNRDGVIQFAKNISGVTSLNRRAGSYSQFSIMNFESSPEAFGFGESAARSVGGRPSRMALALGELLELTCRQQNSAACLVRFLIPGLPREPIADLRGRR